MVSFHEYILRHCRAARCGFRSTWWLPTGAAQTVAAGIVCKATYASLSVRRELVDVCGGGTVAIDWMTVGVHRSIIHHRHDDVVIFIPGAGGCCIDDGGLIYTLIHEVLTKTTVACGMMIPQGLEGLPLTSSHLPGSAYCSTNDIGDVLRFVRRAYKKARIIVIALSMGTALFCNWCARNSREAARLRIGPALLLGFGHSVPQTVGAADSIRLGGVATISSFVIRKWKMCMQKGRLSLRDEIDALRVPGFDLDKLLSATTMWEWDTASLPLYGFSTLEEMYRAADVDAYGFDAYRIPTLIVNSDDDPVCPSSRLRKRQYDRPDIVVVTTPKGGHLGWIDGACTQNWITQLTLEFVNACLCRCEKSVF